MTTDEKITEARQRVEQYANAATGLKGAHTYQTRLVIAALKEIGLKRSQFSARTVMMSKGVYGDAIGEPLTREASRVIIENAEMLVKLGVTVHIGGRSAFVYSSRTPRIIEI